MDVGALISGIREHTILRKLPSLPFLVKFAYGTGELAAAVPSSLSAFFLLYFFTEVADLTPVLAGTVLMFGRLWDAINDPLVGWLSDRTQSPLGRRYPWMLIGVVPLSICFVLLWTVPPLETQWGLFIYYATLSLVAFACLTAVQLPYTALAAELSDNYDERTALISMKSAFSIGGSILGLAMAQMVFDQDIGPEAQFSLLGKLSAVPAVLMIGVCVIGTYRRYWQVQAHRARPAPNTSSQFLLPEIRSVFRNAAFRKILGLYLCGWVGIQLTAVMLPYFVDAWMELPESHFARMALTVQGTAIAMVIIWERVAKLSDKRTVFLMGAPLAVLALFALMTVQSENVFIMYLLGVFAGMGVATMYMVPFSMLPDVVDLDELQTGLRREGLYFSAVVFLQKFGVAIALFASGVFLDLAGFIAGAEAQPPAALWTIRLLIGPLPAILLLGSLWFAYRYPINRDRHQQILLALEEQRHQKRVVDPPPSLQQSG